MQLNVKLQLPRKFGHASFHVLHLELIEDFIMRRCGIPKQILSDIQLMQNSKHSVEQSLEYCADQ